MLGYGGAAAPAPAGNNNCQAQVQAQFLNILISSGAYNNQYTVPGQMPSYQGYSMWAETSTGDNMMIWPQKLSTSQILMHFSLDATSTNNV